MKKITLFFVSFWLMTAFVIAQTPQAFKYQAVARTSSGNLIQNQLVAFRISILQGSPSGTLLYQERHTTNTNNYGLANLDIGDGIVLAGTFSNIDWAAGETFIKVEFDPMGGTTFTDMGTTQLLSVPYSLYSETSGDEGLTLPYSGTISNNDYAFSITNTSSSGISSKTTASSGNGIALYGETASSIGLGVNALATSTTGQCYGVRGQSNSSSGLGVLGHAASTTGNTYGVKGQSMSSTGYGVQGIAFSSTGINYGVYGESLSSDGYGIYGSASINAIKGKSTAGSGAAFGVYGESASAQGYGVYGKATAISGYNYGVYGESQSIIGTGVYGLNSTLSGGWCSGVVGKSTSSTGMGVYGIATSATGQTRGIRGYVASPDGFSGYFEGGKFFVDGTVGIGTDSPSRTLSVHGGNSMSAANFINNYTGSTASDGLVVGCAATLTGYLMNYENAALVIGTNNQYDNIVIQSNGNIGIGTPTPVYLLDIGGTVNLNKGVTSGIALRCNGDEAIWYNNTYFSWGYAGTYNFFGNKLKIAGNGNVAPTYELQVDGNAAKSSGGSTWIVSSDLGLKDLIGSYTKGLDEIMALQPLRFSYKAGNSRGLPSDVEQVGFVAQEVQEVFPEAVNEGVDGLLDFNMHPVNVALINAIKELNEKIVSLEEENNELKAASEDMKARLSIIEAGMSLSSTK